MCLVKLLSESGDFSLVDLDLLLEILLFDFVASALFDLAFREGDFA